MVNQGLKIASLLLGIAVVVVVIILIAKHHKDKYASSDITTLGNWTPIANMKVRRFGGQAMTSLNGKVYVMGGNTDEQGVVKTVEVYDPAHPEAGWVASPPMLHERLKFAAVSITKGPLANSIMVMGGDIGLGALGTTEIFEGGKSWSKGPDMAHGLSDFGAAVVTARGEPQVVVVGGLLENGAIQDTVSIFKPAAASVGGTWATGTPMRTPRSAHCVVELDNLVYAIGGYGSAGSAVALDSVESYDIGYNEWTTMASMSIPRIFATAFTLYGKIYVMGGFNSLEAKALTSVDVYDPKTRKWGLGKFDGPVPSTIRGAPFATTTLNNKAYITGNGSPAVLSLSCAKSGDSCKHKSCCKNYQCDKTKIM